MRFGPDVPECDESVTQTDGQGFLTLEAPSGEEQIEGMLLTHDRREGDRQAEDVVVPEPGEIGGESCLGAANAEVRQAGQPEAGSNGGTLDRHHDRRTSADEPRRLDVHLVRSLHWTRISSVAGTPADVCPRAEVLSFGTEHDGATGRVGIEHLVCVGQRSDDIDLEEVLRRSVHFDGCDEGVVESHGHIAKAFHVCPPASPAFIRPQRKLSGGRCTSKRSERPSWCPGHLDVTMPAERGVPNPMRELEERVTLVTGAGSGIGRAVACELARLGALVVASDLSIEGAEETVHDIEQLGGTAVMRRMDVTSESEVTATVADLQTSIGPVSVLVNCAGISSMARFVDLTERDWDLTMDVNAKGVFLVTREVVRTMVSRRDGCVISIASAAGKEGTPFLAHYSASKWAVLGLTQSVAREVAPFGVRVNAVCPGCVRTPMQDREVVWEGRLRGMDPEEVRQNYIAHTPLGRLCEPQDVADVIVFLCSDKARFMTGQAINVTGGIVLH